MCSKGHFCWKWKTNSRFSCDSVFFPPRLPHNEDFDVHILTSSFTPIVITTAVTKLCYSEVQICCSHFGFLFRSFPSTHTMQQTEWKRASVSLKEKMICSSSLLPFAIMPRWHAAAFKPSPFVDGKDGNKERSLCKHYFALASHADEILTVKCKFCSD